MRVIVFMVDLCIAFMIGAAIALALNFCHLLSGNQNNPNERRAATEQQFLPHGKNWGFPPKLT